MYISEGGILLTCSILLSHREQAFLVGSQRGPVSDRTWSPAPDVPQLWVHLAQPHSSLGVWCGASGLWGSKRPLQPGACSSQLTALDVQGHIQVVMGPLLPCRARPGRQGA